MSRRKSSGAWMQRHVNDPYVKQAQQKGYRARAAFKLIEILAVENLLHKGNIVVDLGAAPGSWSQVARERLAEDNEIGRASCRERVEVTERERAGGDKRGQC